MGDGEWPQGSGECAPLCYSWEQQQQRLWLSSECGPKQHGAPHCPPPSTCDALSRDS